MENLGIIKGKKALSDSFIKRERNPGLEKSESVGKITI